MLILNENATNAIDKTCEILLSNGVAAVPTETVYGLVTLWDSQIGREKIYELKKRPSNKLLQMLSPSIELAFKNGMRYDIRLEAINTAFWPGALTVVATADPSCGFSSIGLRIPAHPFIMAVMQKLGRPLAATSANLSGQPAGLTALDAVKGLSAEPDIVIDGGDVSEKIGQSSTVVSILETTAAILRQGPISLQDILKVLS